MKTQNPIDLSLPMWRDDPNQLKAELLARSAGPVVIDADLERPLDTLSTQIVLAARRAVVQAGHGFELRNPSDAVRNGLRLLGVAGELLGEETQA